GGGAGGPGAARQGRWVGDRGGAASNRPASERGGSADREHREQLGSGRNLATHRAADRSRSTVRADQRDAGGWVGGVAVVCVVEMMERTQRTDGGGRGRTRAERS